MIKRHVACSLEARFSVADGYSLVGHTYYSPGVVLTLPPLHVRTAGAYFHFSNSLYCT